jgi:hypothetical protein
VNFPFDTATAVRALGDGRYQARVYDGWDIRGNANGGYLLALVGNAMRESSGRPLPVAISCHYLAPINDADVAITTDVLKVGKGFTTVTATMWNGERPIVTAVGSCADQLVASPALHAVAPPDLPPYEAAVDRRTNAEFPLALMDRVDVRLHPDDAGFATGKPTGVPHMRGWFAFRDERPVDPLALLLACDAFPPNTFNLSGVPGWVPTVQLSFYLRGIPDGGPVRGEFVSRQIVNGMFEEDGTLWDTTGRVVAQSRQLALLPR